MNFIPLNGTRPTWLAAALLGTCLGLLPMVQAAPGAHGPNGEHLDSPAMSTSAAALPRVEASSEAFELVAESRPGELVIVVDRYETNEPVLGATLEVESGALKAVATFRAEQGDYVVTEPALLKALAAPGEHALVFTLLAGADSDLLDGTLVTGAAAAGANPGGHDHGAAGHDDHDHDHDHQLERAALIGAGIAGLGLLGGGAWWWQRRRGAQPAKEIQ